METTYYTMPNSVIQILLFDVKYNVKHSKLLLRFIKYFKNMKTNLINQFRNLTVNFQTPNQGCFSYGICQYVNIITPSIKF